LETNRIPNPLPLSKGRGIKKIELKRLPRHSVPGNDDSEFLLPRLNPHPPGERKKEKESFIGAGFFNSVNGFTKLI